MIFGLLMILSLVLLMPFTSKFVERNLEIFLFTMGIAAVIVSGVLDMPLITKAVRDPVYITLAVLVAGLLFRWFRAPFEKGVQRTIKVIPIRLFVALFVIILGLISSIITAIIAAIVLVAVVSVLRLDRKSTIRLVILACYSIGLGAVLTPIGEPLSAIATSKLNEEFFYLFKLLAIDIIPGVVIFGLLAGMIVKPPLSNGRSLPKALTDSYVDILIRSFKVYVFVLALTFLGTGFEPLIQQYLLGLNPHVLYWLNMISAILDNATLAAAEISPAMDSTTVKAILLGLLVSGGMLIPGNIPNIIAAGKLDITSLEWARFGVPIGLLAMAAYFSVILAFH